MLKKFFILVIVLFVSGNLLESEAKNKDLRSRELKHQYEVLKDDAKKVRVSIEYSNIEIKTYLKNILGIKIFLMFILIIDI